MFHFYAWQTLKIQKKYTWLLNLRWLTKSSRELIHYLDSNIFKEHLYAKLQRSSLFWHCRVEKAQTAFIFIVPQCFPLLAAKPNMHFCQLYILSILKIYKLTLPDLKTNSNKTKTVCIRQCFSNSFKKVIWTRKEDKNKVKVILISQTVLPFEIWM